MDSTIQEQSQSVSQQPPEIEQHIQGLLSTLQALKQSTTTHQPTPPQSTNIYYPQRTPTSPDVSHLPLPPNLSIPTTLRLIPSGAAVLSSSDSTLTVPASAFELSTPTALLQSLHFYFPEHISRNMQMGLYPTFTQVGLIVGVSASQTQGQGQGQVGNGSERLVNVPLEGVLNGTGSGGEVYMERLVKEAGGGRLRGVVVYVDWRSEEQEDEEDGDGWGMPGRRVVGRAGRDVGIRMQEIMGVGGAVSALARHRNRNTARGGRRR